MIPPIILTIKPIICIIDMYIYKKSATYPVTLLNKICSGNEN